MENCEKKQTHKEALALAQSAFNAWIRERDEAAGCCSCEKDRQWDGIWTAGHFIDTKTQALRFHSDNVHKQCNQCNVFLHGNLLRYRQRLIKKIGVEKIEWLESDHEKRKFTIAELVEIKKEFQLKKRLMRKEKKSHFDGE